MFFKIIRNMYLYLMILFMFELPQSPLIPKSWQFRIIRMFAMICLAAVLLLVLPYGLMKTITKNITKKDADEAIKDRAKWLAIYSELSEFEWRNEDTIFGRIIDRYGTLKEVIPEMKERPEVRVFNLDFYIHPREMILFLLRESDIWCYVRLETKSEFVARNTDYEVAKSQRQLSSESIEALQSMFEQQFEIIERQAKDDFLKNLYLERDLMFLKKIGNGGKKQFPPKLKENMIPEGSH